MKQFIDFVETNKDYISISQSKDRNGLVFAFVGDAVFSLFVRTYLADISTAKAGVLHTEAVKFVRASYQKRLLDLLENKSDILVEKAKEETDNAMKQQ